MMVMSVSSLVGGGIAGFFVTVFTRGFKFEGCVGNAVLGELLTDGVLDVVRVSLGDHVEGCVIVVSVHTPHVDVVNVLHALNMRKMLAKLGNFDAVRRFFEEEVKAFFQITNSIDKDKRCHADRHQRIDDRNIGKAHDNSSHENNEPTEDVLKHVQVDRLLVERITFPCEERREEIDRRTDNGKEDHSIVIDGCGVDDTHDSVVNNKNRADQKNQGCQDTTDDGITSITVGVVLVGLLFALLFEKVRGANACGIADIVHGIGYNGNAARKKAAYKFKYRKCEVENKCNKNISFGFHRFLPLFDGSIIAYSVADCNRIFSISFAK